MEKNKFITKAIPLPNGKRKYVRAKTKEELERKIAALRTEVSYGVNVSDQTTVKEYGEYWFYNIKVPAVSENTASAIHGMLRNHIYPYIGSMKVRDIRAAHIRQVMIKCSHLSRGMQAKILSHLRSIFTTAVEEDNLLMRTPVPTRLAIHANTATEVEPLSPEQEAELLKAAEGTAAYPMVVLLLGTGLRRGELTGLMWSDIDYDERVLHVRRHVVTTQAGKPELVTGAKTRSGVRDIPLTDNLVVFLKGMQAKSKSLYLFTTSNGAIYSAAAMTALWNTLNKRLSFHCHPHQLRHTYATKLFEDPSLDIREIQRVLGHSDPTVTLQVYTHYREALRQRSTLDKIRAAMA